MNSSNNNNYKNSTKIKYAFNYKNDDEWYTTKEDVEYFIIQAKINKNKIIWCPFDTKDSNFVKMFKLHGYKVVYSHIWEGKDFYKYEPKKWDIIVSNPPFRFKHKLLERLFEFNKPFALIFGIQCLNSEKFCDQLQKFKRPQYVHLKRRMCFTKDVKNYINVWDGVNYKNDNKEYC